jgi:hypothetical protein
MSEINLPEGGKRRQDARLRLEISHVRVAFASVSSSSPRSSCVVAARPLGRCGLGNRRAFAFERLRDPTDMPENRRRQVKGESAVH